MIPFTSEQFLKVFELYNLAVWPVQVLLYLLGFAAAGLALARTRDLGHLVCFILSLFWLWAGLIYHVWFFTAINGAAWVFATLFVLQALLFAYSGVTKERIKFRFHPNVYGMTGGVFMLYAFFIYPALGHLVGHQYPAAPTFGVPCPITILTMGLLLWTDRPIPLYLLAIPLAWSLIGSWAAVSLGMAEDYGLLAAGVIGSLMVFVRDCRPQPVRRRGFPPIRCESSHNEQSKAHLSLKLP